MAELMEDFPAVYRAHHGFVWHALHRFGLGSGSLEDAVQDVFIVAYRRRDGMGDGPLKAWLYGIARRVASNYRRAGRRRDRKSEAYGAAMSVPRQPLPEAIIALDDFLERLPHEDRELFVLSEVEGLSGPEIAAARGHNVNTIYTQIRKLRRGLGAEFAEPERVRKEQRRASARSWGLLMPWLGEAPVGPAVAAGSATAAKWGLGLALASSVAAAVGVAAGGSTQEARPRPSAPDTSVTTATAVAAVKDEGPGRAPAPADASRDEAVSPKRVVVPAAPRATPPAPRGERGRGSAADAEPTATGLSEENKLLRSASAALREGRATEALRWTSEHHRRFPKSSLADLRTAVRIEALCLAGKARQAQAEGKRLMADSPSSAAARRVRSALKRKCDASPQKPAVPDTTRP